MNNKSSRFHQIISKEDYENYTQEEKNDFLIDNKIYVRIDIELSETELKKRVELYGSKFLATHYINTEVKYDIIRKYLAESFIHWDISEMINRIKLETSNAINDDDRINILEKYHKKYLKKLSKLDFSNYYFQDKEKNQDPLDFYFKDIVTYSITDEFVMNYVFISRTFYEDEDIFKQWTKVAKYDKTLTYIKERLDKQSSVGSDSKKTKSKLIINYNIEIFIDQNAQQNFHDILTKLNAISDKNIAQKRIFQPVCNAIFSSEFSNHILKPHITLRNYIKFLNKEYYSSINPKNSKLSSGVSFIDSVDALLSKLDYA